MAAHVCKSLWPTLYVGISCLLESYGNALRSSKNLDERENNPAADNNERCRGEVLYDQPDGDNQTYNQEQDKRLRGYSSSHNIVDSCITKSALSDVMHVHGSDSSHLVCTAIVTAKRANSDLSKIPLHAKSSSWPLRTRLLYADLVSGCNPSMALVIPALVIASEGSVAAEQLTVGRLRERHRSHDCKSDHVDELPSRNRHLLSKWSALELTVSLPPLS